VEQPSVKPTTVRPNPSSVLPGVKDVFVSLTETPAPSDFSFKCAIQMLLLTYLLTYLLNVRIIHTFGLMQMYWAYVDVKEIV